MQSIELRTARFILILQLPKLQEQDFHKAVISKIAIITQLIVIAAASIMLMSRAISTLNTLKIHLIMVICNIKTQSNSMKVHLALIFQHI